MTFAQQLKQQGRQESRYEIAKSFWQKVCL